MQEISEVSGFSVRNLQYMRKFAVSYPEENYAAAAAQIPWGHNMVLLDKIEKPEQQIWYIQQTIENGWSRSMLEMWIESEGEKDAQEMMSIKVLYLLFEYLRLRSSFFRDFVVGTTLRAICNFLTRLGQIVESTIFTGCQLQKRGDSPFFSPFPMGDDPRSKAKR